MTTARQSLNKGSASSLAVAGQLIPFGEAFSILPRTTRGVVTSHKLTLPEDGKAALLLAAYGMGTTSGWKTVLAFGSNAAPATTEVRVDGAGDILFAAADAITAALVRYIPVEGEVWEDVIDIAANVGTFLGSRRAQMILSATRLVGTATGVSTPVHRPATPTAGQVAISATDDSQVAFPAADAVTRATVRYLAIPGVGATVRRYTVADALAQTVQMV